MNIRINDTVVEQTYNNIQEFDQFWRRITSQFFMDKQVIQYIEINDQKLFTDFERYLVNNFEDIRELKIFTVSELQLLIETIEESTRYLSNVLNEIEYLSSIFYGEIKQKQWKEFSDFTGGLQWLYLTIESCLHITEKQNIEIINKEKLNSIKEKFESTIKELEETLNNKEFITVGDLIEYEFKPLLEETYQLFDTVRMNGD